MWPSFFFNGRKYLPAQFPGGTAAWKDYLSEVVRFPENYKIVNSDEAVVVIEATVDENGKVCDIDVAVPFHAEFDRIALDAFYKSPRWKPAMQYGRTVPYRIRQSVTLKQVEE